MRAAIGLGTRVGRPRRSPLKRLTIAALFAAIAVELLYIVAVNTFLSTSLFARVVDYEPETVDIHYRSAWSWFPGRIHATGVSIRSRDSHMDFILKVDRVDFEISFPSLARKRIDLANVHGVGSSLRVRPRLEAEPTSPAEYADLPPIDGFGPYAVSSGIVSADKWDDTKWHLWTIDLETVTALDVREVWIGPIRFTGSVDIVGRFFLKPERLANVGPCQVAVHSGEVHVGARSVASGIGGTVALTLKDFDARNLPGFQLLRYLSMATDLHLHADVATAIADGASLVAAIEVPKLVAVIRDGIVSIGTSIEVDVPTVALHRLDDALTGTAHATVDVRDETGTPRLGFEVVASDLEARHADPSAPPVARIPRVAIVGDSAALDLVAPFGDLHARIDVPDLEVADARALAGAIPSAARLVVHAGSVRADAHAEVWLAEQRMSAGTRLRVDPFDASIAGLRVLGGATVEASFASYDWAIGRFTDAAASLDLTRIAVAIDAQPKAPIVSSKDLRLAIHAPVLDLSNPLAELDLVASMPEALVIDSGLVRAYLARGSITRATTDSAAFSLVAGAHVDGAIGRSTIDLQSPRLELVSRGVSVAGDAHARLRAHDLRLDKGDCVLDEASLVFTRVAISPEKRRLDVRPAVTVAEISLRASSARLAFADPFARMAISAALVDGRVHDSASLSTLLPHDAIAAIESDGATFSADAHGALNHRVWSGAARAKISGVGLGGAQVHARGNASLVIDAATINLAEHTARFEGAALLVDHVTGRFSGEAPQFQIRRALIFGRAARIELASPSLAGVDLTVGVDGLVLGDVRDATPLLPKDSVLGLESGRLTASLSFVLSSTETTVHGTLDADLRDGGVRFHTAHYEGNFALRGAVVAMDRTGRVLDVSGSTLAMRDVLVTHTAMATSRWHGDLDFEHATVHLGAPFSIDAYVALDARDADPLLAVALGDDLPSMLTGLAQMPRLKATAHVDIGSGMFSIRDIDATGGDLTIHGVYAARAHHVRGGFAIDKGPVSIGVRLDDHGAQPYLFNLDRWLLDQEEAARHLIEDDPVAPTAPVPTAISAG